MKCHDDLVFLQFVIGIENHRFVNCTAMELCISFRQSFLKLFHLVALIQFAYGIHYDVRANADPRIEQVEFFKPEFGGITRFLTYWGMVTIFFSTIMLNIILYYSVAHSWLTTDVGCKKNWKNNFIRIIFFEIVK